MRKRSGSRGTAGGVGAQVERYHHAALREGEGGGMIRRTQIFPYILCVLSIGASVMYAVEPGRWRNAVYWAAAAVIAFVLAE